MKQQVSDGRDGPITRIVHGQRRPPQTTEQMQRQHRAEMSERQANKRIGAALGKLMDAHTASALVGLQLELAQDLPVEQAKPKRKRRRQRRPKPTGAEPAETSLETA